MTQQRDIERLLGLWFSDGPTESPDRVIDVVADRIERQPQRPAWRLLWRPFPVNAYGKVAVVLAAILIVAVVGYNLLPTKSSNVGGPAATPTFASLSAPPTPSPAAPSSSVGQRVRACDLVTAAELGPALNVSSEIIPDGNIQGSNSEVDYCVYQAAGAEVLGTSYNPSGGGPVFEAYKSNLGVQPVAGLGDAALWDSNGATLFILKGSALVSIEGGSGSGPITLEKAKAVGRIAVGRM